MSTGSRRFNLYLFLTLTAVVAGGCHTHNSPEHRIATIRIHLEAGQQDTDRSLMVPIYREHPFNVLVQNEPFLTEAQVTSAKVVEALGGFDIQVQFDRQGTWLLQEYSAKNRGRHFAIFSEFGEKGKETRWLAAPTFAHLISDGLLQFTPDASREEADEIALGLHNIGLKNQDTTKW
jgi:hypothetical protein